MCDMWRRLQSLLQGAEWKISLWQAFFGASGLMGTFGVGAWAAATTDWLNEWGPIAWLAAGFLSALLAAIIALIVVVARERMRRGSMFAALARSPETVNPLDGLFERKRIDLRDFNPLYGKLWSSKTFRNCEFVGPGSIIFVQHNTISRCGFVNCDGIPTSNHVQFATLIPFAECQFIGCTFVNVAIIAPAEQIAEIPGICVIPTVDAEKVGLVRRDGASGSNEKK